MAGRLSPREGEMDTSGPLSNRWLAVWGHRHLNELIKRFGRQGATDGVVD